MSADSRPGFQVLFGFLDKATWVLTRAAALFLAAMMLITVADILLRTLFNIPIFGTFDLVELFLVAMVYLAIPETFLREDHVVVELIDHIFNARTISVLRVIAGLAALVLLIVMEINMVQPMIDMVEFEEHTLDLSIPKYIHWMPILLGVFCSIFTVALIFVRDLLRLIERPAGR